MCDNIGVSLTLSMAGSSSIFWGDSRNLICCVELILCDCSLNKLLCVSFDKIYYLLYSFILVVCLIVTE